MGAFDSRSIPSLSIPSLSGAPPSDTLLFTLLFTLLHPPIWAFLFSSCVFKSTPYWPFLSPSNPPHIGNMRIQRLPGTSATGQGRRTRWRRFSSEPGKGTTTDSGGGSATTRRPTSIPTDRPCSTRSWELPRAPACMTRRARRGPVRSGESLESYSV